jgi:hypothetical protein
MLPQSDAERYFLRQEKFRIYMLFNVLCFQYAMLQHACIVIMVGSMITSNYIHSYTRTGYTTRAQTNIL